MKEEIKPGCKAIEKPPQDRQIKTPHERGPVRLQEILPTGLTKGMVRTRTVILAFLCSLVAISAGAQTAVFGNLLDITGGTNDTFIEFIPQSEVLIQANGLSSGPARTIRATNGVFSITLNPEGYIVALPKIPSRTPFAIVVPPNAGSINITNLISAPPAYAYQFNGGSPVQSVWTASGNTIFPNGSTGTGNGWVSTGATLYPQ
jgi:hypothetical protein